MLAVCFFVIILLFRKSRRYDLVSLERGTMDEAIQLGGLSYYAYFPEKHMVHNISRRMVLGSSEFYYNFPEVIFEKHLIHPKEEELLKDAFRRIDEGSREEIVDVRVLNKGKYRWKRHRLTSIFDDKGARDKVIVTMLDIHTEVEARASFQKHLEESMYTDAGTIALYRMNLTQHPDSFAGERFGMSPVWEKVNSLSQLIMLLEGKVREEDAEYLTQLLLGDGLLSAFKKGNTLITEEFRLEIEKGLVAWVRLSIDMLENPATGDVEAVLFINDINQEHLVQDMVTEVASKDYDSLILYYANSDFYFRMDHGMTYTEIYEPGKFSVGFRKAFEGVMGGPENITYLDPRGAELSGDEVWAKLADDMVIEQLKTVETYRILVPLRLGDGTYIRKRFTYSYYDPKDKIIFLAARDNTENYLMEMANNARIREALEEANDANQAKTDFLSRMSHDIRTPMNGIIGMSNLIAEEKDLSEQVREYNRVIQTSADFLLGLINDILDMSKIEAGRMELHPEWCSVEEFDRYLQAVINPLCDSRQIDFKVVLPKRSEIFTDKLRFNQLFFNLLSNAVKYTPVGGSVELLFTSERPVNGILNLHAEVRDTGIGMSKKFCEHLFDSFSREERKETEGIQGTGLGLAIAKKIVDMFGGKIWVESELNKGSAFFVEFTCRVRPLGGLPGGMLKPEETVPLPEADYTGKKLLLCEDNEVNARIIMAQVKKLGMEIDWEKNGKDGAARFLASAEGEYSAILMDIRMPVMDGLEATRLIRGMDRGDAAKIPMIAMTANAFDEDRDASHEAGLNRHISKPIRMEEFRQALRELIR